MTRRVEIRTPLGEALQFHRLVGREALSRLYRFEIDLLGQHNAIDPKALLGQGVTVVMQTESGEPRHLGGISTRFALAHQDDRHAFYRLHLRPWLWLATRRSDYDFFARLCEHEGIYYHFRRMVAFNNGIRMAAAAADIDITALRDSINALARLDIRMEANRITITARQEVLINGGSSYTRWSAAGIESGMRSGAYGRTAPISRCMFAATSIAWTRTSPAPIS